ncbi:glycoside hydrolase family 92 protein [Bacteroides salyersiae]|nr:glycoside hydrolase family 92 protein [Bacteroides salyersiae]
MSTLYTAAPDGLCGNEDCGQMSAWYVFSAMGFYPVNPAEQIYVLGKPMLQSAEFTVKDKPFKMIAHNLNKENIYVQSVLLNGKEYDKLYISHEDIVNGGTLEFVMGNVPSHDKDWVLPPSVTVVPSK